MHEIKQTVEIPANHRLTIDVPREVPVGRACVIIQFPIQEEETGVTTSTKTEKKKIPVFGCAKGQFRIAKDFDEPLEDFKDYM